MLTQLRQRSGVDARQQLLRAVLTHSVLRNSASTLKHEPWSSQVPARGGSPHRTRLHPAAAAAEIEIEKTEPLLLTSDADGLRVTTQRLYSPQSAVGTRDGLYVKTTGKRKEGRPFLIAVH